MFSFLKIEDIIDHAAAKVRVISGRLNQETAQKSCL